MLEQVGKGVLLGLGAAMPLGPINVEMARRTLRRGQLAGFCLGAGACSVDVFYAVLSTLSVGQWLMYPIVRWPMTIGSIVLFCFLGFMCLKSAWQNRIAGDSDGAEASRPVAWQTSYITGVLMTLSSPMTVVFWFVGLPGMATGVSKSALPLIAAGVFIGTITWVSSFTTVLHVVGKFTRGNWVRWLDAAGGITLIGFAVAVFLRSMRPHL